MKLAPLLLTATLAANAALLAVYLNRQPSPSQIPSDAPAPNPKLKTQNPEPTSSNPKPGTPNSKPAPADAWSTLATTDLRTLAARLRAAGFPPSVVRAVIQAQLMNSAFARYQDLAGSIEQKPFWATGRNQSILSDPKFRTALNDLGREYNQLLKDALGPDYQNEETSDYERRQFGDLPPEKTERLQKIVSDYNQLRNDVQLSINGIVLPEDREKLALLDKEKLADLAKILTPQELEEYTLRSSSTTSRLRTALTAMNATEAEFRAIYQAQVAFDEKYTNNLGVTTATTMNERQADQARVAEEIKLALGEQRFAEYSRAGDREFQTLSQLAQQAQLPPTAAIQVYDLRTGVSAESNRIFADTNMNNDQKRAALQSLGQNMRNQVTATLGEAAARTYLQSATWLARVEQGAAVTFNLGGGVSTRGLPPAGRPAGGTPVPITNGTPVLIRQ